VANFRLVCYGVAILLAFGLGLVMLRIRHGLARLLAAAMFAWAVNAAMLGVNLYYLQVYGVWPPFRDTLNTANALILAAVPGVIYLWFLKDRHDRKRSD